MATSSEEQNTCFNFCALWEQTGNTNLQKTVFSETEPAWENEPSAVHNWAPLWERPWTKAGTERWSSAARKSQPCLQNRRGCWPCALDLCSNSAPAVPNTCSSFLSLWAQEWGQRWGAGSCLTPAPAKQGKQGHVHRWEGECGLVLLGPSEL